MRRFCGASSISAAAVRAIAARLGALAILGCCASLIVSAGTLQGTVRNGTTGQAAAGVDVILIQLQGGMQPVGNTKTDAQGHFEFTHPQIGAGPMLVRAVYRGVNYHEPIPPGKTTAEVQVFEPTDKAGTFAIAARAVILQPNATDLLVGEEYSIENKTQPPMAYFHQNGSFVFALPDGAELSQVSAAGASGMPVVQGTIDKGKGLEAIDFPFRPGESNVRVSYKVPYAGNETKLRISSPYPVARLAVFAPPGVTVTGEGFSPAGQEQGFNAYMREAVAANASLIVNGIRHRSDAILVARRRSGRRWWTAIERSGKCWIARSVSEFSRGGWGRCGYCDGYDNSCAARQLEMDSGGRVRCDFRFGVCLSSAAPTGGAG